MSPANAIRIGDAITAQTLSQIFGFADVEHFVGRISHEVNSRTRWRSLKEFRAVLDVAGFAMNGQTAEIAPADKKLYALRDATATVEAIPLIVASIISKKGAAGLDAMVIDVKTGSGAFMRERDRARELAQALVKTGNSLGVKSQALITDMNQPLGRAVGNSVEVLECVELLRGEVNEGAKPVLELSIELAARMIVLAHLDATELGCLAAYLALRASAHAIARWRYRRGQTDGVWRQAASTKRWDPE